MRDYQIVSPSLEGVLSNSTLGYEGLKRPIEIMRILDGPSSKSSAKIESSPEAKIENETLRAYFNDLYGVFMKKISFFFVEAQFSHEESIKIQAMLQEMIKIKKLIQNKSKKAIS